MVKGRRSKNPLTARTTMGDLDISDLESEQDWLGRAVGGERTLRKHQKASEDLVYSLYFNAPEDLCSNLLADLLED